MVVATARDARLGLRARLQARSKRVRVVGACATTALSSAFPLLRPQDTMDRDHEAYILLLLSDSNLPTGSFVASAGLESYITHGFFTNLSPTTSSSTPDKMDYTVNFLRDSLATYAHSALPFVLDTHRTVEQYLQAADPSAANQVDLITSRILELDELYETMTLNHITRRASKSQGVALLTLFSKGFSQPRLAGHLGPSTNAKLVDLRANNAATLVDRLKLLVRKEETHGHLPICWGVLTAALGLSSGASMTHYSVDLMSYVCISSSRIKSSPCRTQPVSSSILASPQPALVFRSSEYDRSLRCSTVAITCRSTPRRWRDETLQTPYDRSPTSSRQRRSRQGRDTGSCHDLATRRDPRRSPRSATFPHFQQLGSTRASPLWIHSQHIYIPAA